jgi:hypothetical protein
MEKKQTAVDSFVKKLKKQGLLITEDSEFIVAYLEAKQMEKEQMIDAILDNRNITSQVTLRDAEQYYNETYGGSE